MTKDTYFEKIYGSYYQSILNYMFCRVHNRAIAEELAADVFLLAYKNLDSYDHSKSFITTWLCAIAANHVRNYYKRQKKWECILVGDEIEELSEQVDCIAQKELSLLLEHAICVLPERNRQIVYMKYYRDMTSQEIASRLHVSSGNVRIILKRSLAKMQEVLKSVI